jgi:1,4-dihydroxy-2-naphthoate polyprenyltransferase
VQLTEREFRTVDPADPNPGPRTTQALLPAIEHQPPRTIAQALAVVTRAETTLALVTPVVVGAVLGWWETGQINAVNLLLTLVGMAANGWGMAALWEYHDFGVALRSEARPGLDPGATGFGLMGRGILAPHTVRDMGRILLLISGICSLWLTLLAGWPILFFSGLSFLLVWAVILLPLRFGYRGWGFGEVAVWLAMGLLPLLTGYYGQAEALTWHPVAAGVAFGLFSVLLFFNYNAIHYRRDWLIHKRTLTVNLGLARALDVSALLTVAAYVMILLLVTLSDLPLWSLAALGALPVALGVFARLDRDDVTPDDCWWVYRAGAHATWLTAVLFCAGLIIDRWF